MLPKISVIVPVYNVEKYLHACLDSILAQTFTDFELILIDDGSPDLSGKICDEYAKKDSRIRVFHQENQGQAAARNFGVTQAKAEWIHFVDSDDIIHPQMLELLYETTKKYNVRLCLTGITKIKSFSEAIITEPMHKDRIEQVDEKFLYNLMVSSTEQYHCVCAKLIHKTICEAIPFTAGKTREDTAVVSRWLFFAGKVAFFDSPLYYYLFNPDSTMNSEFSLKNLDTIWAWEQQRGFYESINFVQMKRCSEVRILYFAAQILYDMSNSPTDYKSEARKLKKYLLKNYCYALAYREMTKANRLYILEMLFPKTIMIYWLVVNNLLKKTKRGGDINA